MINQKYVNECDQLKVCQWRVLIINKILALQVSWERGREGGISFSLKFVRVNSKLFLALTIESPKHETYIEQGYSHLFYLQLLLSTQPTFFCFVSLPLPAAHPHHNIHRFRWKFKRDSFGCIFYDSIKIHKIKSNKPSISRSFLHMPHLEYNKNSSSKRISCKQ